MANGGANPQRAQASAEMVAVVPLILIGALALAQLVVAGWALLSAGEAARVGARTAHIGGDGEAAAMRALPSPLEPGEVSTDASGISVEVQAPALLPWLPSIPVSASAALDPAGSG